MQVDLRACAFGEFCEHGPAPGHELCVEHGLVALPRKAEAGDAVGAEVEIALGGKGLQRARDVGGERYGLVSGRLQDGCDEAACWP